MFGSSYANFYPKNAVKGQKRHKKARHCCFRSAPRRHVYVSFTIRTQIPALCARSDDWRHFMISYTRRRGQIRVFVFLAGVVGKCSL